MAIKQSIINRIQNSRNQVTPIKEKKVKPKKNIITSLSDLPSVQSNINESLNKVTPKGSQVKNKVSYLPGTTIVKTQEEKKVKLQQIKENKKWGASTENENLNPESHTKKKYKQSLKENKGDISKIPEPLKTKHENLMNAVEERQENREQTKNSKDLSQVAWEERKSPISKKLISMGLHGEHAGHPLWQTILGKGEAQAQHTRYGTEGTTSSDVNEISEADIAQSKLAHENEKKWLDAHPKTLNPENGEALGFFKPRAQKYGTEPIPQASNIRVMKWSKEHPESGGRYLDTLHKHLGTYLYDIAEASLAGKMTPEEHEKHKASAIKSVESFSHDIKPGHERYSIEHEEPAYSVNKQTGEKFDWGAGGIARSEVVTEEEAENEMKKIHSGGSLGEHILSPEHSLKRLGYTQKETTQDKAVKRLSTVKPLNGSKTAIQPKKVEAVKLLRGF